MSFIIKAYCYKKLVRVFFRFFQLYVGQDSKNQHIYLALPIIFPMIIIPAVDIRQGQCVQLVQGKPGTEEYYGHPVRVAREWEAKGAEALHVVDLDGAFGEGDNLDMVVEIKERTHIPIQFGGGIRGLTFARVALDAGIDRIILGSIAVKHPEMLKLLSKEYGKDRIMAALDSYQGEVVIKGWTEKTDMHTSHLIEELEDYVFGFLVTDVDNEGLMQGVDLGEFKSLVKGTKARICAAGGITTQKDIKGLEKIGAWGAVIGKALYEGKIKLPKKKS